MNPNPSIQLGSSIKSTTENQHSVNCNQLLLFYPFNEFTLIYTPLNARLGRTDNTPHPGNGIP